MTPQQKALELVDKYRELVISAPYVDSEDDSCIAETWMLTRSAKQCALIVVDQIVLEQCKGSELKDPRYQDERLMYWQEVKQEIEKL